jgi:hypothetical protein
VNKYQLITALLGLILLACLTCVEGQQYMEYSSGSASYTTPSPNSVGQTTPQISQMGMGQTANQYSQYFTMGPALNTHITAPQPFNISGNTPATVFFSYERQPVAYSQYQSASNIRNSLWIKGSDSWVQYAEVPQGATVPLLAISLMAEMAISESCIPMDEWSITITSSIPIVNCPSMQINPGDIRSTLD